MMLGRMRYLGHRLQTTLTSQVIRCQSTNADIYQLKPIDYGDSPQLASFTQRCFYPPNADPNLSHVDAERGDIDFSNSDYLGLSKLPELTELESKMVMRHTHMNQNRSGVFPRAPNCPVHTFEKLCAPWMKGAGVMIANSGLEANTCAMQFLLKENGKYPVYIDRYAHETLPLGARAQMRMDYHYFRHNDMEDLKALISKHGKGIVAFNTVYNELGTVVPIHEIVDVCRTNGCFMVADETDAIGIIGEEGEGLIAQQGLQDYVHLRGVSFDKAFGAQGGILVFNEEVVDGEKFAPTCSTFKIFSLAAQDWLAERLIRTLELVRTDDWRRKELQTKTAFFRKGCIDIGYSGQLVRNSQTNILPFVVGSAEETQSVYQKFVGNHIYPTPHYYAGLSKGGLHFTVCNTLTYDQLQATLDFMDKAKDDLKPAEWADQKSSIEI